MNIFIIGPEGAGKTVFATMLNNYIPQDYADPGLNFKDANFKTKQYFSSELKLLESGEWPTSTKSGKMISLHWEWEHNGYSSNVNLVDSAGQDIRRELCDKSHELGIRKKIRDSDLLIVLIDLYGHQNMDNEKKLENAWIIEQILKELSDTQNLILAITKADRLSGCLPEKDWQNRDDIFRLIRNMMPEFNLVGYQAMLSRDNCAVLAFSSVFNTFNKKIKGELIRFPEKPLVCRGLDSVVDEMLRFWGNKQESERKQMKKKAFFSKVKKLAIAFVVGVGAYFIIWYIRSAY